MPPVLKPRTNLARFREKLNEGKPRAQWITASTVSKALGITIKKYEAIEAGLRGEKGQLPKEIAYYFQETFGVSGTWLRSALDATGVVPSASGRPWSLADVPKQSKRIQSLRADVTVLDAFAMLDAVGASAAAAGREREFSTAVKMAIEPLIEKFGIDKKTLRTALVGIAPAKAARQKEMAEHYFSRDLPRSEWFRMANEGEPVEVETGGGARATLSFPPGLLARAINAKSTDEPPTGEASSKTGASIQIPALVRARREWEAKRKPTAAPKAKATARRRSA